MKLAIYPVGITKMSMCLVSTLLSPINFIAKQTTPKNPFFFAFLIKKREGIIKNLYFDHIF